MLMAERLKLAGVAFRPMWYHLAMQSRARFRFVDPLRQGRFEALVRDLAHLPAARGHASGGRGAGAAQRPALHLGAR